MHLHVHYDDFRLAEAFTISRGTKTQAEVITVTVEDGAHRGHGECVPYARYGESRGSVKAQIKALPERGAHEIRWPNILRVDQMVRPELVVRWSELPPLKIDPAQVALQADIAPALVSPAALQAVADQRIERLE